MSAVPDLNRATDDESSTFNTYNQTQATQLFGCYLCLQEGNVENPTVIYHYVGTTYCMDHLYAFLASRETK